MDLSSIKESLDESAENWDRFKELKSFEETKSGVKGLIDSGIVNVPKIFIRPADELADESNTIVSDLQVPVIDLSGIESEDGRKKIVAEAKQASKEWGFFQVVNHGIPLNVLEEMLDGIRKFHELDAEVKIQFHSRETVRKVKYASNVDLYRSRSASWRDSLTISLSDSDHLEPDELPEICRDSTMEYLDQVSKLSKTLFELLSEALGLKPEHLGGTMECGRGRTFIGHYYPPCPEPELTMGTNKHTDPSVLTILLQDQIGGLQVLHDNQYINVPPLVGSLVVNIGDMLQIMSNDEFISTDHRVVANRVGPRISVAGFFSGAALSGKIYGPIKELISKEHQLLYKDFTDNCTAHYKPHLVGFEMAGGTDISAGDHDRLQLLKAFDDTEAGVKGLTDSGLQKIPKIFVRPPAELDEELTYKKTKLQVPVIDLSGIQIAERRKQIIEEVRIASETWGFFQVVNHGIPLMVLDGMIEGVRNFHEMDVNDKRQYYSRDFTRKVKYSCNYDLYTSRTANWRDTLSFSFKDQIDQEELPVSCRNSTIAYAEHVQFLGTTLLELLSEALGLKSNHLKDMECSKGHRLSCHYYPACPEPELTLGTSKHSDPGFLTILLQDQIVTCLQVIYQNQWVDIHPVRGGLVINIGDLLRLASNGKFRSSEHRVIATRIGPRISVACFLTGPVNEDRIYGPIKELVSEEDPQKYKEVRLNEYALKFTPLHWTITVLLTTTKCDDDNGI